MAETVAIDLLINAAQSAKTVGDVRKAMKDLKNGMLAIGDEGSKDFQKLAKAGAELQDNLGDINDRMDAFNPDKMNAFSAATSIAANGVQLVTSAMALFGDQSEDVQKAMMKVQAAMSFSQAIMGMKGLKKEFQTLYNYLKANPLIAIATALALIATAGYNIYKAFQEANSESGKLTKQLEQQKVVTAKLTAEWEAQITVLQAQGGSEKEIFEIKKKMMQQQIAELELSIEVHKAKIREVQDNDSLWESIVSVSAAIQEKMGNDKAQETAALVIAQNKKERAEEDIKALQEEQNQLVLLKASVEALEITEAKRIENIGKANKEAKDKQAADNAEAWEKELELLQQQTDAAYADEAARAEARKAAEQKDLANHAAYLAEKKRREQEAHDLIKAQTKAEFELKKKVRNADLQVASDVLGAMAELAGDNAKAQKAFAAGQTLVDTYLAAQKAYTSQLIPGDPSSPIRGAIAAAAAVISGIARMKKILAVNMNAPSGGGGGADSGTGAGISALSTAPQVQPTTQLDSNGNVVIPQQQQQQPLQAFMVESQARGVGNRVEMFETASRW